MSRASHRLLGGEVREQLQSLPDESVHVAITSPPFFGLRNYGSEPVVWGGEPDCPHYWVEATGHVAASRLSGWAKDPAFDAGASYYCGECEAWQGALGQEPTPDEYAAHLVEVFREIRRVLRPDGTAWLNLGDTYAARRSYQIADNEVGNPFPMRVPPGLKEKDLIGIPWLVAFALQADGWWLRSDIIWEKRNPMPESVKDRPSRSHEYLFLLAKSARYFYDADAVRLPLSEASLKRLDQVTFWKQKGGEKDYGRNGTNTSRSARRALENLARRRYKGANIRDVWELATQPYPGAHFATFPEKLVEPCVLAGTSGYGVCADCGAPWKRRTERAFVPQPDVSEQKGVKGAGDQKPMDSTNGWGGFPRGTTAVATVGWDPTCGCGAGVEPATVLDPFVGSGTAGAVAVKLGPSSGSTSTRNTSTWPRGGIDL